ncbi:MAG: TonB-dependent receptor [Bacteroidales bacterium]
MKRISKQIAPLLLTVITTLSLSAQTVNKDTTIYYYPKEISINSTPRETYQLRRLPASTSILDNVCTERTHISSIKDISYVIPNLYIPEYGSKLTSAIYIRGIGSRYSPSPSVGLYVDNVPYIDKSAFYFEFFGIDRIEILRGPQGTLYGRNALGGIINIRTISPFAPSATTINLYAGSYGRYKGSFNTNHSFGKKVAFSLGGFYSHQKGFFNNDFTSKKADKGNSEGGRLKLGWKISSGWSVEAISHLENTDQNAYPYGVYDKSTEKTSSPNYNDTCSYERLMSTNSLLVTHNAEKWKVNLISSYQYIDDKMRLDQDFSPLSLYTMKQAQKMNNFSQEAIFKSENSKNYQFVSGASAFYQKNRTDAPVVFGADGIYRFFQSTFNSLYSSGVMPFQMNVTNTAIPVYGNFEQQNWGLAAFHQVTLNRVFVDGLSIILGLRYEYEHQSLDYYNETSLSLSYKLPYSPATQSRIIPALIDGTDNQSFGQFLPKIALQYRFDDNNKIFLTSARGYKAGGYNIQMFSDLVQSKLMAGMSAKVTGDSGIDADNTISYRPEYNWNNEIGYSGEVIPGKLFLNGAIFYIASRDQQVVQFASTSGLGRVAKNAAKSYSAGVELSLNYKVCDAFETTLNYGYTNSKFRDYTDNQNDYSDNYVPFVPQNTLHLDLNYTKEFPGKLIDKFNLSVQLTGAGKIYWTEKNDVAQDFYTSANIGTSITFSIFELSLFLENITNNRYNTFYFETLGTGIAQQNIPFNLGAGLKIAL